MNKEKKILNFFYHWLIVNLPFRLMYKHVWIDSQHKMWLPRWGWSKKQIENADKKAKELSKNITWD